MEEKETRRGRIMAANQGRGFEDGSRKSECSKTKRENLARKYSKGKKFLTPLLSLSFFPFVKHTHFFPFSLLPSTLFPC